MWLAPEGTHALVAVSSHSASSGLHVCASLPPSSLQSIRYPLSSDLAYQLSFRTVVDEAPARLVPENTHYRKRGKEGAKPPPDTK